MPTLVRRSLSIGTYAAVLVTLLLFFPLVLVVAIGSDLLLRAPWTALRCLLFAVYYLACELVGIAVAGYLWMIGGPWTGRDQQLYADRNFALQCWWARRLGLGSFRIFGIRLHVEGDRPTGERPVLVFIRHASMADTMLPALLISGERGIRLRYVLKRELLWDPCLDVVGHRLRNYFVGRGTDDKSGEVARVAGLLRDCGPGEGVLIYPEGTRFTTAKKRRIVERLRAAGDLAAAERAERLRSVLPPRPGGSSALLEMNVTAQVGADAIFVAHTGFEGGRSFRELWAGALVNRDVWVQFRRVPFAEIPTDPVEQREWLYDRWESVDDYVADKQVLST